MDFELAFGNQSTDCTSGTVSHLLELIDVSPITHNNADKFVDDNVASTKGCSIVSNIPSYYTDLKTLIGDDVLTATYPSSILSAVSTIVDVLKREKSLVATFEKLRPRHPDMIQQLSCFYRFHAASIEMERMNSIQNCSSMSLHTAIHLKFDSQIHAIIDRVEDSLHLLASINTTADTSPQVHRSRPVLCRRSLKVLEDWYECHLQHPYPTACQVEWLATVSSLTTEQIKKWFGNKRSRSKNTRSLTEIAKVKRRQKLVRRI